MRDKGRIHLSIPIHFHHNFHSVTQCRFHPCNHCTTDASIGCVVNHLNSTVICFLLNKVASFLRTFIIDHINGMDFITDRLKNGQDLRLRLIGRDYNADLM